MKYLTLTILLLSAFFVVACGGDAPAAEPEAVTIELDALDSLAFSETELSIPTGANVTVNMMNTGGLEHNFILVTERADPLTVTEADAYGGVTSGTVAGGDTATVTFQAPAPGTYKYVCAIAGHAAGGMVGTLTVTP